MAEPSPSPAAAVSSERWSLSSVIDLIQNYNVNESVHAPNGDRSRDRISVRPVPAGANSNAQQLSPENESVISRSLLSQLTRRNTNSATVNTGAVSITQDTASDDSPAAAAERLRLSNGNVIDLQAASSFIEQCLPYLVVVIMLFICNNYIEMAQLSALFSGIMHVNSLMAQQMASKKGVRVRVLSWIAVYVFAHVFAVMWMGAGDEGIKQTWSQTYRLLLLQSPREQLSIWATWFTVIFLDSLVRLASMLLKVALIFGVQTFMPHPRASRQQGRILTALEYAVQLYRKAMPTTLWYCYFVHSHANPFTASAITAMYLTHKGQTIWKSSTLFKQAFELAFRTGAVYGTYVACDELLELGGTCPICQDAVACGVKLPCSHVYCEECICEWLERDRTCPMCRADIRPPGLRSHADGAVPLLPNMF